MLAIMDGSFESQLIQIMNGMHYIIEQGKNLEIERIIQLSYWFNGVTIFYIEDKWNKC